MWLFWLLFVQIALISCSKAPVRFVNFDDRPPRDDRDSLNQAQYEANLGQIRRDYKVLEDEALEELFDKTKKSKWRDVYFDEYEKKMKGLEEGKRIAENSVRQGKMAQGDWIQRDQASVSQLLDRPVGPSKMRMDPTEKRYFKTLHEPEFDALKEEFNQRKHLVQNSNIDPLAKRKLMEKLNLKERREEKRMLGNMKAETGDSSMTRARNAIWDLERARAHWRREKGMSEQRLYREGQMALDDKTLTKDLKQNKIRSVKHRLEAMEKNYQAERDRFEQEHEQKMQQFEREANCPLPRMIKRHKRSSTSLGCNADMKRMSLPADYKQQALDTVGRRGHNAAGMIQVASGQGSMDDHFDKKTQQKMNQKASDNMAQQTKRINTVSDLGMDTQAIPHTQTASLRRIQETVHAGAGDDDDDGPQKMQPDDKDSKKKPPKIGKDGKEKKSFGKKFKNAYQKGGYASGAMLTADLASAGIGIASGIEDLTGISLRKELDKLIGKDIMPVVQKVWNIVQGPLQIIGMFVPQVGIAVGIFSGIMGLLQDTPDATTLGPVTEDPIYAFLAQQHEQVMGTLARLSDQLSEGFEDMMKAIDQQTTEIFNRMDDEWLRNEITSPMRIVTSRLDTWYRHQDPMSWNEFEYAIKQYDPWGISKRIAEEYRERMAAAVRSNKFDPVKFQGTSKVLLQSHFQAVNPFSAYHGVVYGNESESLRDYLNQMEDDYSALITHDTFLRQAITDYHILGADEDNLKAIARRSLSKVDPYIERFPEQFREDLQATFSWQLADGQGSMPVSDYLIMLITKNESNAGAEIGKFIGREFEVDYYRPGFERKYKVYLRSANLSDNAETTAAEYQAKRSRMHSDFMIDKQNFEQFSVYCDRGFQTTGKNGTVQEHVTNKCSGIRRIYKGYQDPVYMYPKKGKANTEGGGIFEGCCYGNPDNDTALICSCVLWVS